MNRRSSLLTKQIVILSLFVMCAFALAAQAQYYVRPGGNGNGSSWSNAAGSPSNAPNGTTVYVAGGTYSSSWSLVGKSNVTVKRATAADHGSDSGWQASYDSQVVLSGGGTACLSIGGNGITIDGQVWRGIWIRGGCQHSVKADFGNSYRSDNLTLRYLELGGTGSLKNGEDGIQGRGDNLVVEYCYIHDNDTASTHGDNMQWFSGNSITVRYNVFKDGGQQVILGEDAWGLEAVSGNIYYNVFYNTSGSGHYNGIAVKVPPPSGTALNVFNNTFKLGATGDGFDNVFVLNRGGAGISARNNIYTQAQSASGVTGSNNLCYDNRGGSFAGCTSADPKFVNYSGNDFHLQSGSPAINAGVNIGLTKDFDGNALVGAPDIGAFEYGSGSQTSQPPPPPTNLTAIVN